MVYDGAITFEDGIGGSMTENEDGIRYFCYQLEGAVDDFGVKATFADGTTRNFRIGESLYGNTITQSARVQEREPWQVGGKYTTKIYFCNNECEANVEIIPSVFVEADNATVTENFVDKAINESINNLYDSTVVLDVSGGEIVTSVTLPVAAIETIIENEKTEDVEVKLPGASIQLDSTALAAIAEQLEGDDVSIQVIDNTASVLSEKQIEALKKAGASDKGNVLVVSASIVSGGEAVHDFKGGKATIAIPFTPAEGTEGSEYAVIYVGEDGSSEVVKSEYKNGYMYVTVGHFSDFVITMVETTPMYRLYNPNSGEHFFTGSIDERGGLVELGWIYEGVAWNSPVYTGAPVYRLYNPNVGDHHYTMDAAERDWLVTQGWTYEGVAWNSADANNAPQYRLYNPNAVSGIHHYTGSVEERDWLVSLGWIYEDIGWYGTVN